MGMYCDVYGVTTKFGGLLHHAVKEACGDEAVEDSVVVLTRDDVQSVVEIMRSEILDGWAKKATLWSEGCGGTGMPLNNLQDIMHYSTDVRNFELLCLWLCHTDEMELVWA